MFRAIIFKDICFLKRKPIVIIKYAAVVVGTLLLVKLSNYGSGIELFGRSFVSLFIISVASLSTFLDLYMSFLQDDRADNIVPILAFNKMSFIPYWIARAVIPLAVSAQCGLIALCGYTCLLDRDAVLTGFLFVASAVMFAEVVLAMGLGMVASLFIDTDIVGNPNIAVPFMGANAGILYCFNPAIYGVELFALTTIVAGVFFLGLSARIARSRYRGTIRK